MSRISLQITVESDVTDNLLSSDIIDWVMFKDVLYTREIDSVINFIKEQYSPEYIDLIPDLVIFLDMLYDVKSIISKICDTADACMYVKSVSDNLVVVEIPFLLDVSEHKKNKLSVGVYKENPYGE